MELLNFDQEDNNSAKEKESIPEYKKLANKHFYQLIYDHLLKYVKLESDDLSINQKINYYKNVGMIMVYLFEQIKLDCSVI